MARTVLWDTTAHNYNGDGIFRDSNGNLHVVGFSADPGNLYYAISTDNGATFTDGEGGGAGSEKTLEININTPLPINAGIVVDSNDNIYVFWVESNNELYFKKKPSSTGGTWSAKTSISDAVSTGGQQIKGNFRVELDSSDNIIITGINGDFLYVFVSTDGGSTWTLEDSKDMGFSPGKNHDMCLDYQDNLWVAVERYVYKITKATANTWSIGAQQDMSPVGTSWVESGIVAERDSETIWFFISIYVSLNNVYIRYKKYSGGSWGSWTELLHETTHASLYRNPNIICDYDNNLYAYFSNAGHIYYFKEEDGSWSSKSDANFTVYTQYFSAEHPRNLPQTWNRQTGILYKSTNEAPHKACFDKLLFPLEISKSDTITLSDEILLNIPQENLNLNDTINLSDDIYLKLTAEELIESEIITLSDEIQTSLPLFKEDVINLSDEIYVNTPQEQIILNDTINLSDSFNDWQDIINDFRMVMGVIKDIKSDFRSVIEVIKDTVNAFSMAYLGDLKDVKSDIRYATEPTYDITNDFRMLKSWQVPGDAGFQSLGKEYIKVYINGNPDDDVDINSVSIHKVLNTAHTANFIIGRPYDTVNKPTIEHEVEIRYYETNWTNYWLLYKGYITQIIPGDSPDSIKINCEDKYWLRNREQKYFYVGHQPSDNHDLYYETISLALSECGWNPGVGNFVPQIINCFGRGESDCISALINNSGNFGWFYDVDGTKKLWTAGQGSIINLERQEIGKNIGIYQVLKHFFTESITNLINRFRVTMGDKVIRRFNDYGGSKEYDGYYYYLDLNLRLTSTWNSSKEILARNSDDGYGFDKHPTEENSKYTDVYTTYTIPFTSTDLEAYTDRFEPRITIEAPIGAGDMKCSVGVNRGTIGDNILKTVVTGGYTIDYKNRTVTFGERVFLYTEDDNKETNSMRAPIIRLSVWKQKFISRTDDPTDNPQNPGDITSPLVFITDKMGDYATTIWRDLRLSGLGIQYGGWYMSGYDDEGKIIWRYVPSWDDTAFAQDYADWQLSQNCDKKIQGSIDLTIDAVCHYGIDLSKQIMINNVLENSLNITSMTYNLGSFTVTLELENSRYYKRSVSIQPRGV